MIARLLKLFRKTEKPEEPEEKAKECDHDWAVVEHGDIWVEAYIYSDHKIYMDHKPYFYLPTGVQHSRSANRVCAKCGKCDPGIERYKKAYAEQEKAKRLKRREQRRRAAWAKQLWEDGCQE